MNNKKDIKYKNIYLYIKLILKNSSEIFGSLVELILLHISCIYDMLNCYRKEISQ
jgi:hypothetical protein